MASGTGALGGTAHCYRFWLGFTECRKSAEDPRLCIPERHDYMECLSREGLVSWLRLLSAAARAACAARRHCSVAPRICGGRGPCAAPRYAAVPFTPRRRVLPPPSRRFRLRARSQKARIVAKARALEQEREAAKAGPAKAHAAH